MGRVPRNAAWGADAGTTGIRWACWWPGGTVEPASAGGRGRVAAGLPAEAAIFRVLPLPAVPRRELTAALRWELQRILPFPVDDATFDYCLLPGLAPQAHVERHGRDDAMGTLGGRRQRDGLGGSGVRVAVAGATMEAVDARLRRLQQQGVRPAVLEPEWVTLWRLARFLQLLGPAGAVCGLVDLGASGTRLMVIGPGGEPVAFHRSAVGGLALENELASRLGVPAEKVPRLRESELAQDAAFLAGTGSAAELMGDVARLLRRVRQETGRAPRVLWAAGGGALWPALTSLLGEAAGEVVRVPGDPGQGADADGEPSSNPNWAITGARSLARVHPRWLIAAGLALWHAAQWARRKGLGWPEGHEPAMGTEAATPEPVPAGEAPTR